MLAKQPLHAQKPIKGKENSLDDTTLWQSFKKGNDFAFSVLYKKYVNRLYNYGIHACKDRELVMDCLQEFFARLWDKRNTIADVEAVNFYLFKSFRRLLINKIIANRRFSISLSFDDHVFEFTPSLEDSIMHSEMEKEKYDQLQASIHTLTKRQREAIFLKFFNELTYHEVAAVMEMHVDSVYNLISKAISALRKNLTTPVLLLLLKIFTA